MDFKKIYWNIFDLMEEENTDGDDIHSYITDAANRFIVAMTTGEYGCLDVLPRAEIAAALATPEAQADFLNEWMSTVGGDNYRALCEAHMSGDREAFEAILAVE